MWQVLGTSASLGFYLAAKPSYLGADVDGLAWLLYRPTVCG
jgi:hypothetical protein